MPTADTVQQLAEAKVLIQAKRYEEARALLLTIDDPTADRWLERLKEYVPSAPVLPPAVTIIEVTPNKRRFRLIVENV